MVIIDLQVEYIINNTCRYVSGHTGHGIHENRAV